MAESVLQDRIHAQACRPRRAKGVPRPSLYGVIAIDADGTRAENGKQLGVGDDFDKKLQDLLGDYTYYAHNTISSTDSVKNGGL